LVFNRIPSRRYMTNSVTIQWRPLSNVKRIIM